MSRGKLCVLTSRANYDSISCRKHWGFSIGWIIKQLFHCCFGGIDKTSAPQYRGHFDAPLPSAEGNSAASYPRHLGAAVLTIPQTGMK